jgi:GT2 family glycosyltransferase
MRVRILMITYRRVAYTRLSLSRLCETLPDWAKITVWDNNSGAEMRKLLEEYETHPRIEKIIFNENNDRLRGPTNWFWQNSTDADLLGKVDDDCLMPPGWCETLTQAHDDIPTAGALACWHFPEEDVVPDIAERKVQRFGGHRIMRNCWVQGSGYLIKRSMVAEMGGLADGESFQTYCTRAAAAGRIHGWYYPFIYLEHMDDPRAPHTEMKTEEDFHRLGPLSAKTFRVGSREDWVKRLKYSAWSLQACSTDPRYYLGWRAALRRKVNRLLGTNYLPRA